MKFRRASEYHGVSECGHYTICRSNAAVGGAYTASRSGRPDRLLGTHRFADEKEQGDAYRAAVALCERDEGGSE